MIALLHEETIACYDDTSLLQRFGWVGLLLIGAVVCLLAFAIWIWVGRRRDLVLHFLVLSFFPLLLGLLGTLTGLRKSWAEVGALDVFSSAKISSAKMLAAFGEVTFSLVAGLCVSSALLTLGAGLMVMLSFRSEGGTAESQQN